MSRFDPDLPHPDDEAERDSLDEAWRFSEDFEPSGVDWMASPPFITSTSGSGDYYVTVRVHSMGELHAAYDLILKAFSDAHSDMLAKRWADANQG